MTKHKHLTLSERIRIEHFLNESCSFRYIAKTLGKNPSTISNEIKNHLVFKKTGAFGRAFNDCSHRHSCSLTHLCESPSCKSKLCSFCDVCFRNCSYYTKTICDKLSSPPYVCNGCLTRRKCTLEKRLYSASAAQKEYEHIRSESRTGISISEEDAAFLDKLISPLIFRGQSIHHICSCRPDAIMYSEKTIYNYVDAGLFSAKNLDLPRKVKYRPRKVQRHFKVDRKCRIGRTYDDFKVFMEDHPDTPVAQIDSVEGIKGGKVLLTIHFTESQLMLAFLRDSNNSESVINIFENLYLLLNPQKFMEIFPMLLGDNGSEFSNPLAIEYDGQGNQRTRLFYCDPSAPQQKGAAENNHEFIRRILPKGTSFNDLTQEKVNLMMNHINSYRRKKLGDNSPYDIFKTFYGEAPLEKLGLVPIAPSEVTLQPSLLK